MFKFLSNRISRFTKRFTKSDFYRNYISPPEFNGREYREFIQFSQQDQINVFTAFCVFLILATLVTWPLDFFLSKASSNLFYSLCFIRIIGIFSLVLVILTVNLEPLSGINLDRAVTYLAVISLTLIGFLLSRMGGINSIWFQPVYFFPVTLAIGIRYQLIERALILTVGVLGLMFGFIIRNPYFFLKDESLAFMTFIFIAYSLYLIGGHLVHNLYKLSFRNNMKLKEEQKRSQELLLNILPEEVAKELKNSNEMIANGYEEVTVLFADIVDFTPLAEDLRPSSVIRLLDDIISSFDEIVSDYPVEKIKTVGDEYFLTSGVPEELDQHAKVAGELAIEMLETVKSYKRSSNQQFNLRVGLNTGPVVAGVIGTNKFVYDVWGDTVNVGSRMESQGKPGEIQITPATKQAIEEQDKDDHFAFEKRGPIQVKGKGEMTTYLLKENKNLGLK